MEVAEALVDALKLDQRSRCRELGRFCRGQGSNDNFPGRVVTRGLACGQRASSPVLDLATATGDDRRHAGSSAAPQRPREDS
jgi:hypothetical protein